MNLKTHANQLKHDIPAVFLAVKDHETPWPAKALSMLTIAYALSPIDLIPDFISVLGYLDDVIILPAMIALTIRLIPAVVWACHRENTKDMWKEGAPKRWEYAVPVVLLWRIVICCVFRIFL